jgi:hypothetical protein
MMKGLPIGSREIQSPHYYWIYKRLTLPDLRWQAANAQYMLALQLNRLTLNRAPRVVFVGCYNIKLRFRRIAQLVRAPP